MVPTALTAALLMFRRLFVLENDTFCLHCICNEDFPQKVILIVLDKGRFLFEVGVPKFIFLQSAVSASKCFHLKYQTRILIDFEISQTSVT